MTGNYSWKEGKVIRRMKAVKNAIATLNKCYAVAELDYDGERHLICSAEKSDPCYAFTLDGKQVDKLWDGPGGVMTLTQYPLTEDSDPILMATQKFYSPNDSAEARIVYYTHEGGKWICHVLADLPFVHRFGILRRNGSHYLIACTLKSAHAFRDDWTCPGRIWVAPLPKNIRDYSEDHQLEFFPLESGLYKNHGFCIVRDGENSFAMVGTENGVYRVIPPAGPDGKWSCENVLATPASDVLYQDYDGDGERELLILSPFHGDTLSIYRKMGNAYEKVWVRDKKMPFIHAVWGAEVEGKQYAFVGHREGDRELIAVHWENGQYVTDILDQGAGPANCMYFEDNGVHKLIASNRETDEVALYTLTV